MDWLRQRGIRVIVDSETSTCVQQSDACFTREELAAAADLLIVFGGDGTSARCVAFNGRPSCTDSPIQSWRTWISHQRNSPRALRDSGRRLAERSRVSERTLLEAQVVRGDAETLEIPRAE